MIISYISCMCWTQAMPLRMASGLKWSATLQLGRTKQSLGMGMVKNFHLRNSPPPPLTYKKDTWRNLESARKGCLLAFLPNIPCAMTTIVWSYMKCFEKFNLQVRQKVLDFYSPSCVCVCVWACPKIYKIFSLLFFESKYRWRTKKYLYIPWCKNDAHCFKNFSTFYIWK